jgi:beta-carotene 3-hydroxylase
VFSFYGMRLDDAVLCMIHVVFPRRSPSTKYANVLNVTIYFFVIFALPSMSFFTLESKEVWTIFSSDRNNILRFCYTWYMMFWFIKDLSGSKTNKYLIGLQAHKVHHKHMGKDDGECFGMLFVPFKYYKV